MNCPKCDTEMEIVTYADIEVDRCTSCKGLWFDALETDKLKETPGSEAIDVPQPASRQPDDTTEPIICPKCHTRMIRMVVHGQPHIQYESCTVCYGSFFDMGEFADMKELTFTEWLKSLLPPRFQTRRARYVTPQIADVGVPRELFAMILDHIQRFGEPPLLLHRG